MSKNDFYGKGWKFPPAFDRQSGTTLMVSDLEDVMQSLEILIGTLQGDRVMQPLFGTELNAYAFQTGNPALGNMIASSLRDKIVHFESRIDVNGVRVDLSRIQEGIMSISLDFTLRETNNRRNIVFPFFLEEGNLIPERLIAR